MSTIRVENIQRHAVRPGKSVVVVPVLPARRGHPGPTEEVGPRSAGVSNSRTIGLNNAVVRSVMNPNLSVRMPCPPLPFVPIDVQEQQFLDAHVVHNPVPLHCASRLRNGFLVLPGDAGKLRKLGPQILRAKLSEPRTQCRLIAPYRPGSMPRSATARILGEPDISRLMCFRVGKQVHPESRHAFAPLLDCTGRARGPKRCYNSG